MLYLLCTADWLKNLFIRQNLKYSRILEKDGNTNYFKQTYVAYLYTLNENLCVN